MDSQTHLNTASNGVHTKQRKKSEQVRSRGNNKWRKKGDYHACWWWSSLMQGIIIFKHMNKKRKKGEGEDRRRIHEESLGWNMTKLASLETTTKKNSTNIPGVCFSMSSYHTKQDYATHSYLS